MVVFVRQVWSGKYRGNIDNEWQMLGKANTVCDKKRPLFRYYTTTTIYNN